MKNTPHDKMRPSKPGYWYAESVSGQETVFTFKPEYKNETMLICHQALLDSNYLESAHVDDIERMSSFKRWLGPAISQPMWRTDDPPRNKKLLVYAKYKGAMVCVVDRFGDLIFGISAYGKVSEIEKWLPLSELLGVIGDSDENG